MTPTGDGVGFATSTHFSGQQAVISARGELDLHAGSQLGALFDLVVAGDFTSVVLDLSEVDTLSAECLAVTVDAAGRLAALARHFAVRSPSPQVRRLLETGGLTDKIEPDLPGEATGEPPEAEFQADMPGLQAGSAFPSPDDAVDGALRMVVALTRVTMDAADGVSVSLRRNGRLSTVAASDQVILDMDTYQYATGEGPCIDASVEGRRFQTQSLADESRWPAFTPKAHSLGISAILSTPLTASQQPVGALNIYSHRPAVFGTEDEVLASLFAAETSTILTEARADISGEEQGVRIQAALRVRRAIAQAQGVIMERRGVSQDDAYTVLRLDSQRTGRSLHDLAEETVASSHRPERDPGTGHRGDHRG